MLLRIRAAAFLQFLDLFDRWELLLGEGRASLGQGQRALAHLREHCEPVVDGPEEVVEIPVTFGLCKTGP